MYVVAYVRMHVRVCVCLCLCVDPEAEETPCLLDETPCLQSVDDFEETPCVFPLVEEPATPWELPFVSFSVAGEIATRLEHEPDKAAKECKLAEESQSSGNSAESAGDFLTVADLVWCNQDRPPF